MSLIEKICESVENAQREKKQREKDILLYGFIMYELGHQYNFTVSMVEEVERRGTRIKLAEEFLRLNKIEDKKGSKATGLVIRSRELKIENKIIT